MSNPDSMNYYMGIDIGTGGCKAAVFDVDGHQISMSYRDYNIISLYPGWAELDTGEIMAKCFDAIRESASALKNGTIKGMGISSQGEAFTLIDSKGNALCNALVSSDSRANEMIKPFTEKFGEEKLYRITGHTPHPMFSLFKLLWIQEKLPDIWSKADKILCLEDLLQYRLGIKNPSMGWSLAGRTMLFDVSVHKWSSTILNQARVKAEQLSNPLPSGSVAGYVAKETAIELNLTENTFVVTGGHDQTCSALGAGAIESGIAVYTSGTVECITPAFKKPVFTEDLRKNNLCTYDHTAPGLYATVAFSLTGGNPLKWFRNEFGAEESEQARKSDADPYDLLLEKMPETPSRLIVLPYFTPSGTPHFDVSVKGAIFGLDLTVSKSEILKALLEGVALEMRLNLDILAKSGYQVNELRLIGGGASSAKLIQLKSDVIGMPISTMDIKEAGCLGAAIIARAADTKEIIADIVKTWVRPVLNFHPHHASHFQEKFADYKKIYPALKALFPGGIN